MWFAKMRGICLHRFEAADGVSVETLPRQFTYPFHYVPCKAVLMAEKHVEQWLAEQTQWADEIGEGKMFGVLVVTDTDNRPGFLAAFSGNILHSNNHPGFVPPIYDLLNPDGFFRAEEAQISAINHDIDGLDLSPETTALRDSLERVRSRRESDVSEFKRRMAESKVRRDEARRCASVEELHRLDDESRFEKAELRRMKARFDEEISRLAEALGKIREKTDALRKERHQRSAALQRRLFDCFRVHNALGEERGLPEIFEEVRGELPPAGAGECAAPKLLEYAYRHGLHPVAMGEFWWGKSPKGEIRRHLHFYPACKSKCEPILGFMLRGLDVEPNPMVAASRREEDLHTVYEDEWLWIVDKPGGMPSVPGRNTPLSVDEIARKRFPEGGEPLVAHRLDMATSGLLVVAKTSEIRSRMQKLFATGKVEKTYMADLVKMPPADEGVVELRLISDLDNRPMQMVDDECGKPAVTRYRVVGRNSDGSVRVEFHPLTGRTHQLRVHSSHPRGLDAPIVCDSLYGTPADCLHLRAVEIRFELPVTGKNIDLKIE